MNRKEILKKVETTIKADVITNEELEQCRKLLQIYFQSLENIYSELIIKTELYQYVDLVWLIDKEQKIQEEALLTINNEGSSMEDFYKLLDLRETLISHYDNFINSRAINFLDVNKHYLFDKSEFYKIVEREKQNGFELLNKPISLLENSAIPELREDFVGRKKKSAEIIKKLALDEKVSISISGEIFGDNNGGIGKTTLATQIAHFLSNKSFEADYENPLGMPDDLSHKKNFFYDGVLWINVSYATKDIQTVILDIAKQLGFTYFPKYDDLFIEIEEKEPESKTEKQSKQTKGNILESTDDFQKYQILKEKYKNTTNPDNLTKIELQEYKFVQFYKRQEAGEALKNTSTYQKETADDTPIISGKTVRSLEEISLLINNKKALVVIDNAEQNREVFEYIFPRLNGFANILITSRLRIPGVENILIGNLDKEDSKTLFDYSIPSFYKEILSKNAKYDKYVEKLCYEVLEGHPMSINLAAQSPNLYELGIEKFSTIIQDKIGRIDLNKTYKKIFGIIEKGKILNEEETEVLLRGAVNFEHSFTSNDIKGFCLNDNFLEGIDSLYEKSVLRKEESKNSYIVHQIFKDYAVYSNAITIAKTHKDFSKKDNTTETDVGKWILSLNLLKTYDLSIKDRLIISNDIISFCLFHIKDSQISNKKCTEYIFLLDEYDHNQIELQLYASKAFKKYPLLSQSHSWYTYVEYGSIIELSSHGESLQKGTSILRNYSLISDRWNSGLLQREISNYYNKFNVAIKLDFSISSFGEGKLNKHHLENIYIGFDCMLPALTNKAKEDSFNILLSEKYKDKFRSIGIYFSYLIYRAKYFVKTNKKPLKKSIRKKIVNFYKTYGLGKVSIEFFDLLEQFYLGNFNHVLNVDISDDLKKNYKGELTVLKALSLYKSGDIANAFNVLNDGVKENDNPNLHKYFLFNLIVEYASRNEAQVLFEFDELLSKNLDRLYQDNPTMLLIPEGKTFTDEDNKLLLDETYLADNLESLIDGTHNFTKYSERDLGLMMYPYLINKNPVSKKEYIRFCEETNKDFNENSFNIHDAIEYARYHNMEVATNEEWIKAFTSYNYNLSIENHNEVLNPNIKANEELNHFTSLSILDESINFDNLIKFLIPNKIYQLIKKDVVNDINFDTLLKEVTFNSKQELWNIPVELVRLIAYSPSVNSPKLKHQLIEKIGNSDKDRFERVYKLLLEDLFLFINTGLDKEGLMLEFVSQRNQWKVALKFILGLEDYFNSLDFTNGIEMVHSKEKNKDVAVYKQASKNTFRLKMQTKSGFVPFRLVKPLPLQFELLYKTEEYAV